MSPSKSPSASPSLSPSTSPSYAPDQTDQTFTFGGAGYSHSLLIKPGEILTYWAECASGEEAVARIWLEYTQDGGLVWKKEQDEYGADIDKTGTADSTLSGTIDIGTVKNETNKNKLYRWRCYSMDRGSSNNIVTALKNNAPERVHIIGDIWAIYSEDAPEGGLDGDGVGFAGPGSVYYYRSSPFGVYMNVGSITNVNWQKVSS